MGEIAFFVAGRPTAQGSKQRGRNGQLYESSAKHLHPWRNQIAWKARQQKPEMLVGPVAVRFEFVMVRPQRLPKSKPTPPATKRTGDIEKLARAVNDALSGICFKDDAQVVDMHLRKRIAEPDEPSGVHITIQETA